MSQEARLTQHEIDEIKIRCQRTTPGPWKSNVEARDQISGSDFIMTGGENIYFTGATNDDQDFIAHARQDIPKLIEEIDRLKIVIDHLDTSAESIMDVLISVMQSNRVGNETVAVAAEVVAADARFNSRVADFKGDKSFDEDRFLELLDLAESANEKCQAAVKDFSRDGNNEKLCRILAETKKLLDGAAR